MEPTNRYFGKVCVKHPELKGERYQSNRTCVGCHRARQRTPEYRIAQRQPKYLTQQRNRKRTAEYRATIAARLKTDSAFALIRRLRNRLYCALHRKHRAARTLALLGVPSIEFYKSYLEAQFQPGMTWENAGKGWHIDHRIPLSTLDLSDETNQRFLFNYKNTRPMRAKDNISRGNKLLFEDLI